ncbi:MAG: FtsX-like permease family protein [Anaerolineaceae bacterium]|nr:FtsX-like permease family protein [Anaerolineaceae bacterium]
MIRPRWRKVFSDLWGNKIRSLLIIASITVGLFAVGIISTLHAVLGRDMSVGYAAIHPANIRMAAASIDQDLVDRVRRLEGVQNAEGARTAGMRLNTGAGQWIAININALGDIKNLQIDQVRLAKGTWPPSDREVVLEYNKAGDTHAGLGDSIEIELPSGKTRQLKVVGIVHDQTIGSNGIGGGFFLAPVQGYITQDTLEWLELPSTFNQVYVTVTGDGNDLAHILQVADRVRHEVENSNQLVVNTIMRRSSDHPLTPYIDAISGVLLFLGLLVVFLSGFLITNSLFALLNQQMAQIGIMKTIGARRSQIVMIYMALIFVFGVLAFLIAQPLADQAANRLIEFLAARINFSAQPYRIVPRTVILQLIIALLVPQVAAFIPIWHGSQISVQEALSGAGQVKASPQKSLLDRLVGRIRRIPRPLMISLRNTFRRKGRLILTLITLGMGGAIFISTFNVRASIDNYIVQVSQYFRADVTLTMDRPYRVDRIQQELSDLPGVASVEGWAAARCELILDNGKPGDSIQLFGPPSDSHLVEPKLLSGRWILPQDQNAIALSERFLSGFPNLKPGDTLRLLVNGKETNFTVVGFFQLAGKSGGYLAYTNYEYLSTLVHLPNKAITFQVVASHKGLTMDQQKALELEIETHLRRAGLHIADMNAGQNVSASAARGLNILTIFLLIMASLTALVGSIGLMGTMSLNVMERTREIGIMRSIGASDGILMSMVIVEGLLIGALSWALGCVLSIPFGKLMSDQVSQAIFDAPASFTITPTGVVIWFGAVLVLSILASVIPARNAARLTIREVLSYE